MVLCDPREKYAHERENEYQSNLTKGVQADKGIACRA